MPGSCSAPAPLALRVLWPHREPAALHAGADPNQRAVVARVSDGAFDLLLTADAESDVTAPLELAPVEALKVAHHGSADPGLGPLLRRLRPAVAAIEVGRHNSYGHPDPSTLRQLKSVPHVYRTDRDGTIVLTVEGGRLRVRTERWVGTTSHPPAGNVHTAAIASFLMSSALLCPRSIAFRNSSAASWICFETRDRQVYLQSAASQEKQETIAVGNGAMRRILHVPAEPFAQRAACVLRRVLRRLVPYSRS